MKTQISNSMNSLAWKYLVIVTTLLLTFTYAQRCVAQQKPGWTLVFDDEFNELNNGGTVNDLFGSNGLWYSMGQGWDPEGIGSEYDSPVPPWNPAGCNNPTINTALTSSGTLDLTVRKNPGDYAVWKFTSTGGSVVCKPYTYTGAVMFSKQTFEYGYFEVRAKIPNQGKVLWPAFWLWNGGGSAYREVDVFEFGDTKTANQMGMNEHLAQALDGGYLAPNHHTDTSGAIINDYPDNFVIKSGGDVTSNFHTYAVKWSPNSVVWYADDQPVRTLAGHAPHLDMSLIADIAISPWNGDPDNLLPANYEIDYIRAYRSQSNEFMWQWGNGGSHQIHWWNMNPTDRYLSGKFQGNGKAQLLVIAENQWGWVQMMNFTGSSWDTPWGNNGTDKIHWWDINRDDKYIIGDFLGLGRDQLLAVNDDNGWSQLMSYDNSLSDWGTPWGNSGNGKIAWWDMNEQDQYVAGDFAGLGYDQLLAIDYADGWAQLIAYYGGSWHTIWGNNGNGEIGGWHISPGDHFLAGDFDGKGRKQLMAIATNRWQYAGLLQFSGGVWNGVWSNSGSGKIHWWDMNPTDEYFVGNFDGGKQDQLLATSIHGWSQLMSYSGSDWDTPWGNDGGGTIDLWYMHPSDKYVPGDFNGHSQADLFAVATNGWAHLMGRRLP